MRRQRTLLLAMITCGLLGCGGSGSSRAQILPRDAGAGSGYLDAGSVCTCIALDISTSNAALCDCPQIQYGCEGAPQTFERVCDVAPTCWRVETDPVTGCDMPAYESVLSNPSCSCVPAGNADAGSSD